MSTFFLDISDHGQITLGHTLFSIAPEDDQSNHLFSSDNVNEPYFQSELFSHWKSTTNNLVFFSAQMTCFWMFLPWAKSKRVKRIVLINIWTLSSDSLSNKFGKNTVAKSESQKSLLESIEFDNSLFSDVVFVNNSRTTDRFKQLNWNTQTQKSPHEMHQGYQFFRDNSFQKVKLFECNVCLCFSKKKTKFLRFSNNKQIKGFNHK